MKEKILFIVKSLGGFWLTRKLIRRKTLILAYHGFEVADETSFRPNLFIKPSTFTKRLSYLQRHCNIIKLEDLDQQNKPDNAVVITIDDGWASTLTVGAPLLKDAIFPYTVYLTTEYVLNNQPIFHIVVDYLLQKSIGKTLRVSLTEEALDQVVSLANIGELKTKIEQAQTDKNAMELLSQVAASVGYDIATLINNRAFTLMSAEQVKEISALGADIQLHTHSHFTYLHDEEAFNREILINQQHIEAILGIKPLHHCYPSGSYNQKSISLLAPLGIKTATTCLPGLCDDQSNKLELPRFLDGENISQIIFEAEVSGFLEFSRKLKSTFLR